MNTVRYFNLKSSRIKAQSTSLAIDIEGAPRTRVAQFPVSSPRGLSGSFQRRSRGRRGVFMAVRYQDVRIVPVVGPCRNRTVDKPRAYNEAECRSSTGGVYIDEWKRDEGGVQLGTIRAQRGRRHPRLLFSSLSGFHPGSFAWKCRR